MRHGKDHVHQCSPFPVEVPQPVDFDASPVIRGERSIEEMGPEIYAEILAVATGKLTKSEIHGHYEA